MQAFIATCGAWHLRQTAAALESRKALAALWITEKNITSIPETRFRRCWPFHLAMKPFYQFAPQIWVEKAFYALRPIWKNWLVRQRPPSFDVAHSVMGYAEEVFDFADQVGALKVADCPNTHPTTYYGFWQRECDFWCPGENLPVPRRMFGRMNRDLQRADLIIVQSEFARESMVLNGLPKEKVFINIMGVDTSIFTKRPRPPAKPRFICVGTICLRKGHPYLLRAFEKVKQALPEAELICVGGYKADFRKERPRWEGTFTHHPSLPHSKIAELLQSSTAFVFPSQEEGIARAQIEALASGVPVIGTHPGGTTTVVRDGIEGVIVPPHDIDAIAKAMIRLATDADLNQSMGDAAHKKGAVQNTWQDYGDRLLAAYEDGLARRAK